MVRILKFILRPLLSILYFVKYKYNSLVFGSFGFGSIVHRQMIIQNRRFIFLGKRVKIFPNGRIQLVDRYEKKQFSPKLEIGDDSQIHQNCHITCADNIKIGKNVVLVSNVTITDIIHPHEDINIPINKTDILTKSTSIGDQTYIYNNSVILPGVSIGRHCVIGANSVVNKNIPDFCIAVGNPAKIIKKYCIEKKIWERLKDDE